MRNSSMAVVTAAFVLACLCLSVAAQTASDDLITSLPGLQGPVHYNQYSGYLNVDQTAGRFLFYWFIESARSPSNDPFILWLNGGPGCSSLSGLLTENGPFRPDENLNLVPNADSWNNFANVLYLESPAFVGFSFSKRAADRTVGDLRTAQDAYEAIQVFLDRFPQYRSHNFTVTGESYCGHYGVQLVDQIVQNNAKVSDDRKINLVGYFVGNPWMEPSTGQAAMPITWHEHQVISDTTFEGIMTKCDFTKSVPPNTGSECDQLYQTASNEMGNINVYSLYEDQCLSATQKHFLKHLGGMFDHFGGEPAPQPAPPCVDNWTEAYMNRLDVQKALHVVNPGSVKWAECTTLNYSMADLMTSVAPLYAKYMMMPGLRTAILSGDVDSVCPTSGTKVQLEQLLKFPVVKAWHPYTVNGQTAGYVTEYPNSAKLVTVRNSGHMIPSSQSARSAYIIEKLVTGQDF